MYAAPGAEAKYRAPAREEVDGEDAGLHASPTMRAWWALFGACLAASWPGSAAANPLTADQVKFAESEFTLGLRLYRAAKFDEAAGHFENAFFTAPAVDALRNAVLARRKAHDYARAATLAELARRKYAGEADLTKVAVATIAEARPHVHELVVECAAECGVVADRRIVTVERAEVVRFFVEAGHHDLVVSFGEDRVDLERGVDAVAGGSTTLKLELSDKKAPPVPTASTVAPVASPPPPPPPPPPPVPSTSPTNDAAQSRKPLGPAVFFTGAGLTAAGIAATVVLGVNAENNPGKDAVLRDCVGKGTSCATYQQGLTAQMNANIALAATCGLGLVTTVIGVFFTQWSAAPKVGAVRLEPVVGVQGVGLRGAF